jgi:hypothetical protein
MNHKDPMETIKELQEIATLSAKVLAGQFICNLCPIQKQLAEKLEVAKFLKPSTALGIVGQAYDTD